jgi:hypothetical protein
LQAQGQQAESHEAYLEYAEDGFIGGCFHIIFRLRLLLVIAVVPPDLRAWRAVALLSAMTGWAHELFYDGHLTMRSVRKKRSEVNSFFNKGDHMYV